MPACWARSRGSGQLRAGSARTAQRIPALAHRRANARIVVVLPTENVPLTSTFGATRLTVVVGDTLYRSGIGGTPM